MLTINQVSLSILAIVISFTLYFTWTAVGSTVCADRGIEYQTRTTYAPFTGCTVVDDYRMPDWMFMPE